MHQAALEDQLELDLSGVLRELNAAGAADGLLEALLQIGQGADGGADRFQTQTSQRLLEHPPQQ